MEQRSGKRAVTDYMHLYRNNMHIHKQLFSFRKQLFFVDGKFGYFTNFSHKKPSIKSNSTKK